MKNKKITKLFTFLPLAELYYKTCRLLRLLGARIALFAKKQNFREIAPPKTFQCRIYIRQMVGADFLGKFSKKCTFHEKVLTGAGKYLKYHYHYNTFSQGAKKLWKVAKSVKFTFSITRHSGRLQCRIYIRQMLFGPPKSFLAKSWFCGKTRIPYFLDFVGPACNFPL